MTESQHTGSPMNWPDYFFGFAHHAKLKSKDETQVGAVLVGPDKEVRLTGYNGPPIGVHDTPERRERPMKYMFVSHAEMNLVAFAARQGISTKGCTVYVTHLCCTICARLLIQAGIAHVVYGDGTFKSLDEERAAVMAMFTEAGVTCETFEHARNADWVSRNIESLM